MSKPTQFTPGQQVQALRNVKNIGPQWLPGRYLGYDKAHIVQITGGDYLENVTVTDDCIRLTPAWENVGTAKEQATQTFAQPDIYTVWYNGEGFNVTNDGQPPTPGTGSYRLEAILKLKNLELITYKGIK
jgi:hypothetical protein